MIIPAGVLVHRYMYHRGPSDASRDRCVAVFRVVVAGRVVGALCVDSTDPFAKFACHLDRFRAALRAGGGVSAGRDRERSGAAEPDCEPVEG